ncbi:MAG: aminopeptidase P family protein [Myxococcota bacterium]
MNAPDHAARRRALADRVSAPILLVSNGPRARNLPMNQVPFRADSTFLYFTGCDEPGAAALIVGDACTLFLTPPEPDDALWHGEVEPLVERGRRLGVDAVRPLGELDVACAPLRGRLVSLAVPDVAQTALAARLTGLDLRYPSRPGPDVLVDAVIALRRTRDAWELDQMRRGAAVARAAHVAAMRATRPGGHEREIAALFDAVLAANGAQPSYQSIVTVRGEVLHNQRYVNHLEAGQLLLLDGGGELASGLATDVTRTWPVSGRFDARQRDVYQLVLDTNVAAIARVRAGVRYRDVHFGAMRRIAEGLRDLGLLKVGPDLAVESGAVGLFFPHGVGHLIGLDVHDLENFGDRPAYAPGRARPAQFGARSLRLDLDLEADTVVTIEPGVYFVPAILRDPALRAAHAAHVDFDAAERWLGFGGIRVEDDVRVTMGDPEVLTAAIPKDVDALEAIVGTGPSAAERLSA